MSKRTKDDDPNAPLKRANGDGSVYWRESRQRYICQAYPPGSSRPVYSTVPNLKAKTEANDRAAIRYLNRWLREIAQPSEKRTKPKRVAVRDYLDQWLQRSADGPPGTYRSRRSVINAHLLNEIGDLWLHSVTADDIRQVYAASLKRGTKPNTVKTVAAITGVIFADAVADGLIPVSPAERARPTFAPKPPVDRPVVTLEQLAAFRKAIAGNKLEHMFIVALETGLRSAELRGLRWLDIDLQQGIMVLTGKAERQLNGITDRGATKGRRARGITLSDVAIEAFKTQRARVAEERLKAGANWVDRDLVWPSIFGRFLSEDRPRQLLQRCLREAGLPIIKFHDLRNSFAVALLEETGNIALVADALGHANTQVTEQVYAKVTTRIRLEVAAAMNRRAKAVPAPESEAGNTTVADNVTDSSKHLA